MKTNSDKIIFIGMIPTCIIFSIIFIVIAIFSSYGPQALSNQEVNTYTNAAQSIWNNESTNKEYSTLYYKRTDDSITIYSQNAFKQTVTVIFTDNTQEVLINEPNVSFLGCTIFFSVLGVTAFIVAIIFFITVLKENYKLKT